MNVSPSFLRLLDAWRAAQPGAPSQADAIRRLAKDGRAEAGKPPEPAEPAEPKEPSP